MKREAVRVTVNLPDKVVEALREMAKNNNTTVTEALRRAISTEKLIQDEVRAGHKIIIRDADGKMREVLFR